MSRVTRISLLLFLFSLVLSPPYLWAAMPEEFTALINTDKAFAEAVRARGIKEGFLAYLADDGVLFRPQPINGKGYYKDRDNPPGFLGWQPEVAYLSNDGMLGVTLGPWQYGDSIGAKPSGFGHYITVWRKESDKSWKVIADIGAAYPKPYQSIKKVEQRKTDDRKGAGAAEINPQLERARLMDIDLAFSNVSLEQGAAAAYWNHADEEIRFYRFEEMPHIGRDAINKLLGDTTLTISWTPSGGEIAASGDLGCTFGNLEVRLKNPLPGQPRGESDSYLRVWQRGKDNRWQLIIDVVVPISTPLKKN